MSVLWFSDSMTHGTKHAKVIRQFYLVGLCISEYPQKDKCQEKVVTQEQENCRGIEACLVSFVSHNRQKVPLGASDKPQGSASSNQSPNLTSPTKHIFHGQKSFLLLHMPEQKLRSPKKCKRKIFLIFIL